MEWIIDFYTEKYKQSLKDKTKFPWKSTDAYTPEWATIMKIVKEIHDIYNYDNSDVMTDYFDVNYYWTVRIWKWDKPYKKK